MSFKQFFTHDTKFGDSNGQSDFRIGYLRRNNISEESL
jgi:hypothetical protein